MFFGEFRRAALELLRAISIQLMHNQLELRKIMATQAELATALNALQAKLGDIGTEVDKVGTETVGLQKNVADLTAAINAGDTTSPEVDAALKAVQDSTDSLSARVKAVDDLVPDPAPPADGTPAPDSPPA